MWIIIGICLLPVSGLMLYEDGYVTNPPHMWSYTVLFYVGLGILISSTFILSITGAKIWSKRS
ncbi:MAG: hypothetical protein KGH99_05655 [Thaumarchaeota archaeon]|nr:hypothetical protein [Nitrososphaerota archaeon]MDE1872944.1 hypothetical protein [Nitrososphaerota archaeon]